MAEITTDANGFKYLVDDPLPENEGADAIQNNAKKISTFITQHASDIEDLEEAVVGISVTNYGTTGYGADDDSTALSNAEADAFGDSAILLFPPGTYLIESDVTFRVHVCFTGGVILFGSGVTATFEKGYTNLSGGQCFDEDGRTPNQAGGVAKDFQGPHNMT